MDLREQEYMLAIAKHAGIKGAAEELNLTPPSLSAFLSNLERRTGTLLFQRIGKKFRTTDAGEAYLAAAREMVFLKRQYEGALSKLLSGQSGSLRLGIHPRRTTYLLPAVLREFSQRYPAVDVQIVEVGSDPLFELLMKGEIDFMVDNRQHTDPVLVCVPCYQDKLVAVLSDEHPLLKHVIERSDTSLSWLDASLLTGERLILQREDQAVRRYTDQVLLSSGVRFSNYYVIQNMETAAQMAAEGIGVAFNFYAYIKNFSYTLPIKAVQIGDPNLSINYSIVHRKDCAMPQYMEIFMNILKEKMVLFDLAQ